ncbi:MAG: sodium:alanine symporter family protein [Candidatus Krumholzibacteria bacterium]|nr:sodium:alanine symporter family protein [Candidatus Krumholzibacteria bacterium]
MTAIIDAANAFIWGKALVYLLLGVGAYFTVRTGFIQFRHLGHLFAVMRRSGRTEHGGISSFGAFATGLAGRVGTGNVAGVAIALTVGGPGAVFWMWIVALVGMATSFVENTLAQLYKVREEGGTFRGGPAYYMARGLRARWMGVVFSVFLILSFGFIFNAVQANSMSDALHTAFGFPRAACGLVIIALAGLVIFGGVRRIAHFAEAVVPAMAVAYFAVALVVVLNNAAAIPGVIALVVRSAFGLEQAAAGGMAYAVSQALMQGVRRGLFSNEAGMGSSPNAAAAAEVKHPAAQGFVQMLGVFTDTIVICTCTAAIILLSGAMEPGGELTGVPLTQAALSAEVGTWGTVFVAIILQFFAFTSIVANYYFGETSVRFLTGRPQALPVFRLMVLGVTMLGAVATLQIVWNAADLSMGFMALTNLVAILLLSPVAFKVMRDYVGQLGRGVEPVFDAAKFPELEGSIERDVW